MELMLGFSQSHIITLMLKSGKEMVLGLLGDYRVSMDTRQPVSVTGPGRSFVSSLRSLRFHGLWWVILMKFCMWQRKLGAVYVVKDRCNSFVMLLPSATYLIWVSQARLLPGVGLALDAG
ncbi:hypothetical protein RchiOBHm_Chr7g0208511 [Rosa chinensis]|uniref:Uncharacterized protein n=1 Tax=Rosa chinensis TaxID=74649 RepID=A0A2P6P9Q2_ROSCH|nr:hypothetical protein RchiOBHm_Chr7g0208511 [Rosa chinensis]